jgi:hypothetical protein
MGPTLPQATARYISHPVHMCTQCGQIASVRQIEWVITSIWDLRNTKKNMENELRGMHATASDIS